MKDPLEGVPAPKTEPRPAPDPAKSRFLLLSALRFSGVALAILGAFIASGRVPLPVEAGYVLIAFGVLDAMVLPIVFIRAWKSRQP